MTAIKLSEARNRIDEAVSRAVDGDERVVIKKHGRGIAAVISMEDLQLFEELEHKFLGKEAARRLSDRREKPTPYRGPRRV